MKRWIAAALAALLVFTLGACKQSPPLGEDGLPLAGTGEDYGDGAQGKRVAVMTPYPDNQTTAQMVSTLEAGMEALGMEYLEAGASSHSELGELIEELSADDVDALVLVSTDVNQVAVQIREAVDRGIPVFGCESGYLEEMQLGASCDNYAMGEGVTAYLVDDLMKGSGSVLALTNRNNVSVEARAQGMRDVIYANQNLTLVAEQSVEMDENAADNARQMAIVMSLAYSGDLKGIWCGWEEAAVGACMGLEEMGIEDVAVVCAEGGPEAEALLQDGDSPLAAIGTPDLHGVADFVVTEMNKLFNGLEAAEGEQSVPAAIVTK